MPIQHWNENIWLAQLPEEPALSDELRQLIKSLSDASPRPHLVIDLSQIKRINSSHLAELLRVRKLCIDGDTHLRLAAPTNAVWAVILTTGLDKVFEFNEDVSTALAAVQM